MGGLAERWQRFCSRVCWLVGQLLRSSSSSIVHSSCSKWSRSDCSLSLPASNEFALCLWQPAANLSGQKANLHVTARALACDCSACMDFGTAACSKSSKSLHVVDQPVASAEKSEVACASDLQSIEGEKPSRRGRIRIHGAREIYVQPEYRYYVLRLYGTSTTCSTC